MNEKRKKKISFQSNPTIAHTVLCENHYNFQLIGLPQISLICCIFDMITNRFEHSTRCCHQTTIEYLKMIDFMIYIDGSDEQWAHWIIIVLLNDNESITQSFLCIGID